MSVSTPLPRTSGYAFGAYRLDPHSRVLSRDGDLVALPPKAFDVLLVLIEAAGQVVTKDELLERAWPGTFVEEGNLALNVFTIRKALGPDADSWIRTVRGRGYGFIGPVNVDELPRLATSAREDLSTLESRDAGHDQPLARGVTTTNRSGGLRLGLAVAGVALVATAVLWLAWPPSAAREGTASQALSAPVLVVVPFGSPDSSTEDADVGPGFAAALSMTLAMSPRVTVRPFTSVAKYAGGRQDLRKVGESVHADFVLAGDLSATGDVVRVRARLIHASDGAEVWARETNDALPDWPSRELRVADEVLTALGQPLSRGDRARLAARRAPSPAAYATYLRGLGLAAEQTPPDTAAAIDALSRATDAAPDFAPALSRLAALLTLPLNAEASPAVYARAEDLARRALDIDPRLAEPHVVIARTAVLTRSDWSAAAGALERAMALAPADAEPRFWYAIHQSALGQHDDALAAMQFALELDPTSPRLHYYEGLLLFMARRFDESIAALRRTPLEPGVVASQVYLALALAHAHRGNTDQALSILDRGILRVPAGLQWQAHRAYVLAVGGAIDDAARGLAAIGSAATDDSRSTQSLLAATAACVGRIDEAYSRLEHALASKETRMVFANVDPIFDCARRDSRFQAIGDRLGLNRRR